MNTKSAVLRANAWLIAAYIVSGKLGLLLALPPGYASAIFPPAGIAVAAVLIGGSRLLPGAFLGSLLLNVWTGYATSHAFSPPGLAASSIIALASMLQAAAGGWLLRRLLGFPAALDNFRDIRNFLLAAPLICVVSASISVAGLFSLGIVPRAELPTNWATWWIGDTLGVLVMLPLTLVLVGEPRGLWRTRAYTVAVPMLVSFAIFTTIYVRVSEWEQEQNLQEFRTMSAQLATRLQYEFEAQAAAVEYLEPLFTGKAQGTRTAFHDFAKIALARHTHVRALEWAPRVSLAERAEFERAQRTAAPGFEIRQQGDAAMVRATEREEYFPVVHIEPMAVAQNVVGYDLASYPDRRQTIRDAFATRRVAVTPPIDLAGQSSRQIGLLVVMPVFHGTARKGVVLSVLRMGDFLDSMVSPIGNQVSFRLTDVASGKKLYDSIAVNPATAVSSKQIGFGGREFRIETSPTQHYLGMHRGWESWAVLSAGLLSTGLLGALLLLGSGSAARVEAIVEQRTRALDELRRADAALAHSEARLRGMLESAMDAIITVDERQRVVFFNPAAEALFGYSRDQAIGASLDRFIPERARGSHAGQIRRFGEADATSRRMGADRIVTGLRANAEEFPIDATISQITENGARFYTAILRDMSERVRTIEALQRSNLELQRFAYIASHDLKTPLRSICGFIELVQRSNEGRLDDRSVDWIRRAVEGAQRLETLIDNILTYARLDAAEQPHSMIDCNAVFSDAFKLLEAPVRDTGAEVTANELPMIMGNRSQLVQLFQNLIGNALKYHGDRLPRVQVAAARNAGEWLFSIADNGIGIDARHFDRIFEIFKRLHTQQAYPGTGIGLTLCRRVVHRHGGRIWLESQPGKGSTFFFTIPDQQGTNP